MSNRPVTRRLLGVDAAGGGVIEEMRTVLITGSTDGIGLATAIELARRKLRVVVHGRNRTKAEKARSRVVEASGSSQVDCVVGDLSSLKEVRELGEDLLDRFERLDVLINNAGVATRRRELSADGLELIFAVNHLAPFLLTNLLLPLLRRSAPSRIVNVSSMTHAHARIDPADLQGERSFDAYEAYSRSKLANLLFTTELARRLQGSGVTVNALHPGVIDTKLLRVSFSGGSTPEAGARTSVYLAVSPEVDGISGGYFVSERRSQPSATAEDERLARELWRRSAELVGLPTA